MPRASRLHPGLRSFLVLLLVLGTFLPSAHAGLNRWTPIGPSAAYGITRITADPHDPAVLYAETLDSGIWRSGDGGATWAFASAGLTDKVFALAVDAAAPGVLYAVTGPFFSGGSSFWRSDDGGDSWSRLRERAPIANSALFALIADPDVAGTLYWLSNLGLSKTTDGGLTWSCAPIVNCGAPTSAITAFTADPASSNRLYAVDNSQVLFRSVDGGASWMEISTGLQVFNGKGVDRIAVSPSSSDVLYAWGTEGGLPGATLPCFARSDDGGRTWKGLLPGIQCGRLNVDPEDGRTLRILVGPERRLWTSRDGGETWDEGEPAPALGQILPDPTDAAALLLGGTEGLFRSADGGDHWSRWARQGFNDSGIRVLLGSTEAPGVLYASLGSTALALPPPDALPVLLQKSTDAGRTWTELPVAGVGALAIDPRDPRHLYAVSELSETPGRVNRVYESADGGLTWQLTATQPFIAYTRFGTPRVVGLLVHPLDGRILYAATEGGGVYRSADRGRTWRYSNQGLPIRTRCGTSSCPGNGASELLQGRDPRTLYVLFQGDFYRSTDGGAKWSQAGQGLPKGFVDALALDPSGVLYAAGTIPSTPAGSVRAVFKSTDQGRRWNRVKDFPSSVRDLAANRSGLYAATAGDGVFRSTDGGRTWVGISEGLPSRDTTLLAPDPLVPARIHVATPRNGAWQARFTAGGV
jgi:photosystem II stability/assembly factor-like uncharacterized protein